MLLCLFKDLPIVRPNTISALRSSIENLKSSITIGKSIHRIVLGLVGHCLTSLIHIDHQFVGVCYGGLIDYVLPVKAVYDYGFSVKIRQYPFQGKVLELPTLV